MLRCEPRGKEFIGHVTHRTISLNIVVFKHSIKRKQIEKVLVPQFNGAQSISIENTELRWPNFKSMPEVVVPPTLLHDVGGWMKKGIPSSLSLTCCVKLSTRHEDRTD